MGAQVDIVLILSVGMVCVMEKKPVRLVLVIVPLHLQRVIPIQNALVECIVIQRLDIVFQIKFYQSIEPQQPLENK